MPLEGGLSLTVKTGLVSDDFDENPIPHAGVAHVGFNVDDLHGQLLGKIYWIGSKLTLNSILKSRSGRGTLGDERRYQTRAEDAQIAAFQVTRFGIAFEEIEGGLFPAGVGQSGPVAVRAQCETAGARSD